MKKRRQLTQSHLGRHKKKYLAGTGAAVLAAPFAFQRFRGAANLFRKGLLGKHGEVGRKHRWFLATTEGKRAWRELKKGGVLKRSAGAKQTYNNLLKNMEAIAKRNREALKLNFNPAIGIELEGLRMKQQARDLGKALTKQIEKNYRKEWDGWWDAFEAF